MAVGIFFFFVISVLGLSFYLGAQIRSAKGYYAAGGGIHWFVNGIAFAGDYLSAASFLGICGLIAFYGYDGFLYSIGYLAGWVVALFVIAEPLKRLGRFTFADALDNRFNSRGIKISAAISTLVVSIIYLIPQMVGAGALVKPLLGPSLPWVTHLHGVVGVGVIVITIVITAGMVSTTYVQFIKGSLLVFFCTILTVLILGRGFTTKPPLYHEIRHAALADIAAAPGAQILVEDGDWKGKPYVRVKDAQSGEITVWKKSANPESPLTETQTVFEKDGKKIVVGKTEKPLLLTRHIVSLPDGKTETGPLGPAEFFSVLSRSELVQWKEEGKFKDGDGVLATIYAPKIVKGGDVLTPGEYFKGVRESDFKGKLDFLSLMLALFCGTASLPHILIRYYTVKDQASARKSTVVGIASIGFFYVLTLYLGLAAMTMGTLQTTTNSNMAAPLLAKAFGEFLFAVISAIAFTTVLGTVSGLIMAASGAVAHDIMTNFMKMEMTDHMKVRAGKIAAVFVGILAMVLGVIFEPMNVSFLVGWAFAVAASANLPSLVMLLFWKGTTKQGITAAITAGLISSLTWILLSADMYKSLYGLDPKSAPFPFSQPGIVTIPLGFVVLIVVSLLTKQSAREPLAVPAAMNS